MNPKFTFSECACEADIVAAIEKSLEYDTIVASDEQAEQWFHDAGMEGEVTHRVIVSTHVSVWNDEMQGEETYNVIVKEHFTDPGSDDYVYSYDIS